jgi:hypothetical protein
MTPGAKIRALAYANARADLYQREAKDTDVFADPNIVSDDKAPWEGDVHVGANNQAASDFCTK